ncbi:MAG: YcxB family protein [Verrucomicrobia bacterium]|nr:YcxB family protein [Verrucomicrobiota bacterium]
MKLTFQIDEDDTLAFTEQFLRGSASHQSTRNRLKWSIPCIMLGLTLFVTLRDGFSITSLIIFGTIALFWFVLYPKRFDANIRKYAKKQMSESSYSNMFGKYDLEIDEMGLHSTSNTGSGTYKWKAVNRVELTDKYLFIYLSGPIGYPIRISEIGHELAQSAYNFVHTRCEKNAIK